MINFINCPLCKANLLVIDNELYWSRYCNQCMNDDMPRFRAEYSNDNTLQFAVWWLGKYYIEINYMSQTTTVTYIDVCLRKDSVLFKKILEIDPEDPSKMEKKLDTLMIFS